jgi:hypothetical protein
MGIEATSVWTWGSFVVRKSRRSSAKVILEGRLAARLLES